MERKDFLLKSALLGSMGLLIAYPVLHQLRKQCHRTCTAWTIATTGTQWGLNIRTRIRSAMTNAVYSNVECAVAPKTMGPPHFHKELDELMYVTEGNCQCAGSRHRCWSKSRWLAFEAQEYPAYFLECNRSTNLDLLTCTSTSLLKNTWKEYFWTDGEKRFQGRFTRKS